jgi:hypothetical protein
MPPCWRKLRAWTAPNTKRGRRALVHDIGKLGIPDHILSKPGKLSPEEFARIQRHVSIGTEILAPIPFPFPVVDVVRSYHERWDGLGYPGAPCRTTRRWRFSRKARESSSTLAW